jgi:hypothetical protein
MFIVVSLLFEGNSGGGRNKIEVRQTPIKYKRFDLKNTTYSQRYQHEKITNSQ